MYRIGLLLLSVLLFGCGSQEKISNDRVNCLKESNSVTPESCKSDQPSIEELKKLIENEKIKLKTLKNITLEKKTELKIVGIKIIPYLWERLQIIVGVNKTVNGMRHFLLHKDTIVYMGEITDIKLIDDKLYFAYRFGMGNSDLVYGIASIVNDELLVQETDTIPGY